MLSEYAVFAHCIKVQSMPHWGFVVFSVLLPQWKPRNVGYWTSLHLASALRINQSSLKLIINYSWLLVTPGESGTDQRESKNCSATASFLWLILSLGITVTLCLVGFYFLRGSSTYGVRQHCMSALCCLGLVTTLVSKFLKMDCKV